MARPPAPSRALRLHPLAMSVCLYVCLSVCLDNVSECLSKRFMYKKCACGWGCSEDDMKQALKHTECLNTCISQVRGFLMRKQFGCSILLRCIPQRDAFHNWLSRHVQTLGAKAQYFATMHPPQRDAFHNWLLRHGQTLGANATPAHNTAYTRTVL